MSANKEELKPEEQLSTPSEPTEDCEKVEPESKPATETAPASGQLIEEVEIADGEDSVVDDKQNNESLNTETNQMDGDQKSSEEETKPKTETSEHKAVGGTEQADEQRDDAIRESAAESSELEKSEKRSSDSSDDSCQFEEPALFFESRMPGAGDRTPPYEPKKSEKRSDSLDDSGQFKEPEIDYEFRASSRDDRTPPYHASFPVSPSSSLPRSYTGQSKVLCRFYMKKTGCMRGDKCIYRHPGAVKGPDIEFCYAFQMGRCYDRKCYLVHASRSQQKLYENTGLLPKSAQNNSQVCGTWRSRDTISQRHQQRPNIKLVPIHSPSRSNGPRSPPADELTDRNGPRSDSKQQNEHGWFEDIKPDADESDSSDVEIIEIKGEFECKKEPSDGERIAKKRRTGNQSESSYYESSDGDERSPRLSKHILKLKQVPLDASVQDIEIFLAGYRYKENGIHQHTIDDSSIGVFYVEFDTNADLVGQNQNLNFRIFRIVFSLSLAAISF